MALALFILYRAVLIVFLALLFLICEIRWDKIISISPLLLKFHHSVIEMIETFYLRVECSGREQSFQKVPQLTL